MRKLYEEIAVRFPEVRPMIHEGDDQLPYVLIGHVVDWLGRLPEQDITPEIVARVQAFVTWCEEYPSGQTAANDAHTILVVGFYEKLFRTERTRSLLPKVMSKEMFAKNAEYLRTWLGAEDYQKAAKYFS